MPRPHARVAGSGGGRRKPLTIRWSGTIITRLLFRVDCLPEADSFCSRCERPTLAGVALAERVEPSARAAWLLTGTVLLLFGIVPRFAVAITWVALLYVQLIGEVLGPILLGPTYRYSAEADAARSASALFFDGGIFSSTSIPGKLSS